MMEQNKDLNAQRLFRRRIHRLERLAFWMDEAFEIPILKWRIGLDALFGLIPGFGDVAGAAIAMFFVLEAARLRVSGWVLARMGVNIGLELILGAVPVFGDLLDVYFKSNVKNLALLKGACASVIRGEATSPDSMAKYAKSSKWVVMTVFASLVAALVGIVVMVVWFVALLFKGL